MKPIAKALPPSCKPTDVAHFFYVLTKNYECFSHNILQVIDKLPEYSPQQIYDECKKLTKNRDKLAIMDEKMFDILELAGKEIIDTSLVHDYRIAFSRANMACNSLYQELQSLKAILQDGKDLTVSNTFQEGTH